MVERPTCETCPYWDRDRAASNRGQCRRSEPVASRAAEIADLAIATWPVSFLDDWCGCHPKFPEHLDALRIEERDRDQEA